MSLLPAPHPEEVSDRIAERQFERLVFFSDAVFAIAITLLVLDLKPVVGGNDAPLLIRSGPKILSFIIGFYVIARYWLAHHALFGELQREDNTLRLANLCFLAGIVFLPFPTSILTAYRATAYSVIFFATSAAVVGLLFIALTIASTRPALRFVNITKLQKTERLAKAASTPLVFLLSVPIAIYSDRLAMLAWVLITPIQWLLSSLSRRIGHKFY